MVQRPIEQNAFEFVVLASLRARQLARGCTPRVAAADKITITAQMEVAEGKVTREGPLGPPPDAGSAPEPVVSRPVAAAI